MGYFNYFIKCIIRKFVNIMFKPKGLFVILVIVFLLYLFSGSARAEWNDYEFSVIYEALSNITTNQGTLITQLSNLGADVSQLSSLLSNVNLEIQTIRQNTSMINNHLIVIVNSLNDISTGIYEISSTLDSNQKELLAELEKDNQAVLDELNMIRDAINGSEEEVATYTDLGTIKDSTGNGYLEMRCISLDYEPRYSYTIKLYYNGSNSQVYNINSYISDNLLPSGYDHADYLGDFVRIGTVPVGASNYVITFNVPSNNPKYIYFNRSSKIVKIEVSRSIKGIIESLNDSNTLQQQQNQLQQQQNQLQQEQNNFLQQGTTDSDVSVDGFNNVDSNDITSAGLNGVFTNIYNSITSWNSKNINLPIPYTNKSITIPANYTENMLSNSGGSWLITFIHTIYYFVVGRFMIYSITNIINSIKSGSILNTDSKNNITTDML